MDEEAKAARIDFLKRQIRNLDSRAAMEADLGREGRANLYENHVIKLEKELAQLTQEG